MSYVKFSWDNGKKEILKLNRQTMLQFNALSVNNSIHTFKFLLLQMRSSNGK